MSSAVHSVSLPAVSRGQLWAGRILSAVPVLLLLMSCSMKLAKVPAAVQGWQQFGFPPNLLVAIGIIELAATVLYIIPRTSVLGAILVTGYFGGAIVTHVRVGQAAFITPLLLGVVAWLGLYLREPRLRALVPLRR